MSEAVSIQTGQVIRFVPDHGKRAIVVHVDSTHLDSGFVMGTRVDPVTHEPFNGNTNPYFIDSAPVIEVLA